MVFCYTIYGLTDLRIHPPPSPSRGPAVRRASTNQVGAGGRTHTDIPRSAYWVTGSPHKSISHTVEDPYFTSLPSGEALQGPPARSRASHGHATDTDLAVTRTYMNRGSPARSHLLPPIKIKPLGPSTLRSIALSAAPAQAGAAMYGLSSSLSAWSSRVATSA